MQNNYRKIEPAPVLGKTANAICIHGVHVQLFQSCSVHYELRQITEVQTVPEGQMMPPMWGAPLMTGNITLSGDDYAGWGPEDNYIYEKIAELNGLTLI
jgi:hypothetical protein